MLHSVLGWLTRRMLPPRVIYDRNGLSPYLSRWYLVGRPTMPDASHPFWSDGTPKATCEDPDRLFGVFLHYFHRGDDEPELHNHPWGWSLALVLAGGYVEERRRGAPASGGSVVVRLLTPGMVNVLTGDTFHRVELTDPRRGSWSLFVAGPRTGRGWGFWNRRTGRYLPWREFIDAIRGSWSADVEDAGR